MPPLLDIHNLHIRFGATEAVRGVSFHLDEGEVLGLVGESGSGKSATALAILGLLGPAAQVEGQILWNTAEGSVVDLLLQSPASLRRLRGRQIAMIFQEPMTALNPVMSIGRQVAECAQAHAPSWTGREAKRRALAALEAVSIPEAARRYGDYPHQFSGGQRQRILIAMALMHRPRLLIADEPTTALDVTIQLQILELLYDLKQRLKMAVLLITHDMGVIAGRADRVMVMYAGKIVESADTVELFENTRHPYTEALLASIPRMDQREEIALYTIPGLPPDLANPPAWCRFQPRCRYATTVCREQEPELKGDSPAHEYACFNPVSTNLRREGAA
jgi:oligopeptide/dipeptide ABC transporter ATP-binding protein